MRPHTIPEKLKPLTEPQFTQLHTWLEDLTLKQVRENLRTEFGIDMSDSALCRYNQTRDLARHLTEKDEDITGVREFLAIMNGDPVPYDDAGIDLVMKRAFDLATAREMTPAKLNTLLRVFHYKKSCQWTNTRLEISNRLAKVREEELALKKSKGGAGVPPTTPSKQRKSDHLGPLATTPEEIRARAIAQWGPHPSPPTPTRNLTPTPDPVAASLQGALPRRSTGSDAGADLQPIPDSLSSKFPSTEHPQPTTPREAPDFNEKCQMDNVQLVPPKSDEGGCSMKEYIQQPINPEKTYDTHRKERPPRSP